MQEAKNKICRIFMRATDLCRSFYSFNSKTMKLTYSFVDQLVEIDKFVKMAGFEASGFLTVPQIRELQNVLYSYFNRHKPKEGQSLVFYGGHDLDGYKAEKILSK